MRPFGGATQHRLGTYVTAGVSFGGLLWLGTQTHGQPASPALRTFASLGDGLVSGIFITGAVCAAVMTWRRHPRRLAGWIVASGALLAAQALLVTLVALQGPGAATLLPVAALAGMMVVVVPLLGLPQAGHVVDDGYAVGLGMGVMAAGHLLLGLPAGSATPVPMQAAVAVVLLTHVCAVVLVLGERDLSRPVAWLLVATVVVVGTGEVVHVGGWVQASEVAVLVLAQAAVGAAWLAAGWVSLQRDEREAQVRAEVGLALQEMRREERERLHELRSTLAGLVNGSALLDNPDLPGEARHRLCESVHRELERMQRRFTGEQVTTTELDVDLALQPVLDLQRLKGRRVELHTQGATVRARHDALAEVINVLVDNAATHGGCDTSRVDVVCRDEGTVDITVSDDGRGIPADRREHIFDWGQRGPDSPGEGIGLNVARRLMAEDGGSLRLAETQGPGSAFVISLPAARRSPEDETTDGGSHDTWRLSS